jgi:hypothetical protein
MDPAERPKSQAFGSPPVTVLSAKRKLALGNCFGRARTPQEAGGGAAPAAADTNGSHRRTRDTPSPVGAGLERPTGLLESRHGRRRAAVQSVGSKEVTQWQRVCFEQDVSGKEG